MTNQLELRHFEYFLALADTLHYRKAAEQLFISQSALSQQIKRLEAIVGQKLFIRTNRKVSLSEAGLLFKQEAAIISQQVQQSMERWQLATEGAKGLIRIGFVGSAMQVYLPPILKKFSKNHPKIKFYLDDLSNVDQLKALAFHRASKSNFQTFEIQFLRYLVSSHISLPPHSNHLMSSLFLIEWSGPANFQYVN